MDQTPVMQPNTVQINRAEILSVIKHVYIRLNVVNTFKLKQMFCEVCFYYFIFIYCRKTRLGGIFFFKCLV